MKRDLLLLMLVGLVVAGCPPVDGEDDPQDRGIAVGNPGLVSTSLALTTDVELDAVLVDIDHLRMARCGGGEHTESGGEADLVEAPLDIIVPSMPLCGLRAQLADVLHIEATWTSEGGDSATVVLDLDVGVLDLVPVDDIALSTDDADFGLELAAPHWLDPTLLGLVDGVELVVGPGDALHDDLVAAVAEDSAMFDDPDGSGAIDEVEREDGPLAIAGEITFEESPVGLEDSDAAYGMSEGCSCSSPGRVPRRSLALAVLVGFGLLTSGLRRRRPS